MLKLSSSSPFQIFELIGSIEGCSTLGSVQLSTY